MELDVVCDNINIKDAPKFKIRPRGRTPLIDAGCMAIDKVGCELASRKESEKPSKVIFVIVTDGHENASSEFNRADLMNRVNVQRDVYKWTIMFLGANQDAINEGYKYGISANFSMSYKSNKRGIKHMSSSLSDKFSMLRNMGEEEYISNVNSGAMCSFNNEDRILQEEAK